MIKLLCPNCLKSVSVPDDSAGREVTCPLCLKPFEAPARYNPAVLSEPAPAPPAAPAAAPGPVDVAGSPTPTPLVIPSRPLEPSTMSSEPVDRPLPPPGLVPPAPPSFGVPGASVSPPASAVLLPVGYTRSHGVAFSPQGMAWLPVALLTLTLVSTCFPWVGTYMGGYPVYSQGPWQALFGAKSRNFELEKRMQIPGGWLDKVRSDWELMLPCLLALVVATVLAWADRGFHSFDSQKKMPSALARLWPWRLAVMGLLAGLALVLMVIQVSNGFGLERAIRKVVTEQYAKEREEAGTSPTKLAEVEYKEEQEFARFNRERTSWLYLGVTCNLLAVLAVLGRLGLDRRGNKPPPRIVIQY